MHLKVWENLHDELRGRMIYYAIFLIVLIVVDMGLNAYINYGKETPQ